MRVTPFNHERNPHPTQVPGPDILTPHLLLEGPCLRHLYGSLFRGAPRVADNQLAAVLGRYGPMTVRGGGGGGRGP